MKNKLFNLISRLFKINRCNTCGKLIIRKKDRVQGSFKVTRTDGKTYSVFYCYNCSGTVLRDQIKAMSQSMGGRRR